MPAETQTSEEAIRAVVTRLARPHRSGGAVIERAAILAEAGNSAAIFDWIAAHAGEPEVVAPAAPKKGLYGSGFGGGVTESRGPARYVLPPGTLTPGR
jgi:hypothetical protein